MLKIFLFIVKKERSVIVYGRNIRCLVFVESRVVVYSFIEVTFVVYRFKLVFFSILFFFRGRNFVFIY